jgi:phage terminase large subunit-like protein
MTTFTLNASGEFYDANKKYFKQQMRKWNIPVHEIKGSDYMISIHKRGEFCIVSVAFCENLGYVPKKIKSASYPMDQYETLKNMYMIS